jgi:hypothetical protein
MVDALATTMMARVWVAEGDRNARTHELENIWKTSSEIGFRE